jgi:hypothetical protein
MRNCKKVNRIFKWVLDSAPTSLYSISWQPCECDFFNVREYCDKSNFFLRSSWKRNLCEVDQKYQMRTVTDLRASVLQKTTTVYVDAGVEQLLSLA